MSRALTVYTKKRDEDTPQITSQLERVMASTGCSEPVARNLLKYGKLGIGPLAQPQAHEREGDRSGGDGGARSFKDRPRQSPPRQQERTAASALAEKKRRLREQEERLREQEEQREREVEAEEKARREEQARKRAGLTRLGPVLARQEEVDPLQPVQVEAAGLDADEEEDSDEGADAAGKDRADAHAKQKGDKKRGQADATAAGRRPGKKKRRRRRGGVSEGSSEEGAGEAEEAGEDPERGRPRDSGSSAASASSLMTEAQVLEMMGKDRKTKRGSLRAKSRIQREMEEWESAKRENPEFWKAPKFSLCYSAETRKSRNY